MVLNLLVVREKIAGQGKIFKNTYFRWNNMVDNSDTLNRALNLSIDELAL